MTDAKRLVLADPLSTEGLRILEESTGIMVDCQMHGLHGPRTEFLQLLHDRFNGFALILSQGEMAGLDFHLHCVLLGYGTKVRVRARTVCACARSESPSVPGI